MAVRLSDDHIDTLIGIHGKNLVGYKCEIEIRYLPHFLAGKQHKIIKCHIFDVQSNTLIVEIRLNENGSSYRLFLYRNDYVHEFEIIRWLDD